MILLLLLRAFAIVEVEYRLFVQLIIVTAVVDQSPEESLENLDILFIAIYLDCPSPCRKAQLRIQGLEQQYVTVVHSIEYYWINLV